MYKIYSFLVLFVVFINIANTWDLAVTYKNQIELHTNGTKQEIHDPRFSEITALAYDAVHNILLFVDAHNDNASIFSYHLAKKKFQPLVKRNVGDNIQGIAFDPITGKLFWSDTDKKSIMWSPLLAGSKNNPYGNLLLKTDKEKPRALAVDSCRGYLYWTNTNLQNATIERMRFDGTERQVIIQKDLFMPTSIAIDQRENKLYWADDRQGIHYSIESSDLEGNMRQTLLNGRDHMPNDLAVSKDFVYWTDLGFKSVWKYDKTGNPSQIPEKIIDFQETDPFGVVAFYNIEDQIKGNPNCEELGRLANNKTAINDTFKEVTRSEGLFCLHGNKQEGKVACECVPGYTGERCQTSVCQNYCVSGDCRVGTGGKPICKCNPGFKGARCETNICLNYCLNGGVCSYDEAHNGLACKCPNAYEGNRCEFHRILAENIVNNTSCNCTKPGDNNMSNKTEHVLDDLTLSSIKDLYEESFSSCGQGWDPIRDPIIMALATLCGLLCIVGFVLFYKIVQLKKRPRIKKRFIVNKNGTPLTARPDQCEITIENCCNMNICETPCFEPQTCRPTLLDSKPGKEEKNHLISNMEHQDDLY